MSFCNFSFCAILRFRMFWHYRIERKDMALGHLMVISVVSRKKSVLHCPTTEENSYPIPVFLVLFSNQKVTKKGVFCKTEFLFVRGCVLGVVWGVWEVRKKIIRMVWVEVHRCWPQEASEIHQQISSKFKNPCNSSPFVSLFPGGTTHFPDWAVMATYS